MRRPLDLFVDETCELGHEIALEAVDPIAINILHDPGRLDGGGVLVLGPRTSDGEVSVASIRRFRRRNLHTSIWVCGKSDSGLLEMARAYFRAGADRVVLLDSERDGAELRQQLSIRLDAPPPERELTCTRDIGVSGQPLRVIQYVLRNGYHHISVSGIAECFGRGVTTIGGQLRALGQPGPEKLLQSGRYLQVRELERRGIASADERAQRTGFGTATYLRQWIWRFARGIRRDPRSLTFARKLPGLTELLTATDLND
jgi:hypothetical protein